MGIIRSTPDNQVHVKSQALQELNYVEASLCGWQHYMEDYTGFSTINQHVSVGFVIDGHGGPEIAQLAAQMIPQLLKNSQLIKLKQYKPAIQSLFETLDGVLRTQATKCSQVRQKYGLPPLVNDQPTSGCSLVLALSTEDQIVIANIGECKSYVCYKQNLSKAVLISGNHTQSNAEDEKRVKNAGGFFLNGKVNGALPFTRSIGDYAFKSNQFLSLHQQLLIPTPSIFALRKQDIKIVVLGSSGLWEKAKQVLKEVTEEDLELTELTNKTKQLLQGLLGSNPRQGVNGLKNIAILVIDLKG